MFPLGDDDSQRRSFPIVTPILIAINVVIFLLELNMGEAFIEKWAFVPARFNADPSGQAVTVLTAMFMHGGWMHLIGNMLYLWIFGDNVEDRLGPARFLFFYLVTGLAATLAQYAVNSNSGVPNVGASGAIAGVLGAYLLMFPQGKVNVLMRGGIVAVPAILVLGLWFGLQLFSSVGSIADTTGSEGGGVAFMAHVGGFVAGFLMAFVFRGGSNNPRISA